MNVSPKKYDLVAQFLHWSMTLILLYLIFFSQFEEIPDAVMENKIELHSGLGLLIVVLGLFRWFWRKTRPRPAPVETDPPWQTRAADIIHQVFYALFLLSPAVGIVLAGLVAYPVRIFGLIEISGWLSDNEKAAGLMNSVHGFSADLILYFLVLHVAAALYHQFIKRDGIIWRMTP